MGWQIVHPVDEILKRGAASESLSREQALRLLALPLHSRETYASMQTADAVTHRPFGNKRENHFHTSRARPRKKESEAFHRSSRQLHNEIVRQVRSSNGIATQLPPYHDENQTTRLMELKCRPG